MYHDTIFEPFLENLKNYLIDLSNYKIIQFPILLILLICLFYMIETLSSKYMSVSVDYIVETMQIRPDVAAITLVTFVNGFPDVLDVIFSSQQKESQSIVLGSLLGALLFCIFIVAGYVLH